MQEYKNPQFEVNDIWQTENSRLFKTEMQIYGKDLSGMLAVRKTDTAEFRVIFINEVGMKFFDFEISESSDSVLFIFEPMNKKMFVKMLTEDYRNIFFVPHEDKNNLYINEDDKIIFRNKNTKMYYTFFEETGFPYAMYKKGLLRKKFETDFRNYKNNFPQKIKITHHNIKFYNNLTLIK